MTRDYGHATAAERERMDSLEAKGADVSADERLELALLNLEPAHESQRAVDLLRSLVRSDGGNHEAHFWLAYCCVYELLSPRALEEAIQICDELLGSEAPNTLKAAALMLKATALRDLRRNECPIEELKQSIALAPDWVSNRQLLAQVLLELGDRAAATAQLERAVAAESVSTDGLPINRALFEELVTARAGLAVRDRIREQLDKASQAS